MKILVVEDEERIASFIETILVNDGNKVTVCDSVECVLKYHYELSHDFIILDLMLAGKRGEFLVKEVRKKSVYVPILVLSALSRISNKIELLNLGADDYMTKPFDSSELVARVNALYRRYLQNKKESSQIPVVDDIVFKPKEKKVIREGSEIALTKKESDLLEYLLNNRGKTVMNEDILRYVWGSNGNLFSNVVQSTVRRLRNKVDKNFSYHLIENRHGIGYYVNLSAKERLK